jgi:hypothetical protein
MGTGPAGRGIFTVWVTTRRSVILVWNNEIPYVHLHFGSLKNPVRAWTAELATFLAGFTGQARVKNGPFFKFDFLDYRMGKQ